MILLIFIFMCLANIAQAEILINNTQLQLSTNEQVYDIKQDLGQTVGNNLFHTFERFNLNQGEIAQFSGHDSIQNIITRVVGGEASFINGTIRSTIPNADFYFLNPHGIVFDQQAQLDLTGSFYASTADYIKFADGGEYHARFPKRDILSVAPIASFGFLQDTAATLQVVDAQLTVAPTKTLALVGGDIYLNSTIAASYDESSQHQFAHELIAPSGQIILDSRGQIELNHFGVDSSGPFGGQITIRAEDLILNSSRISSHTFTELNGQVIDIEVDNLVLHDADILANTYASGKGSDIHLRVAQDLTATRVDRPMGVEFGATIRGGSHVSTLTVADGASGNMTIQANNIYLNQADIGTTTFGSGQSGNLHLQVTDTLQAISGLSLPDANTVPAVSGAFTLTADSGNSGDLDVQAKNIILDEGAIISVTSIATGLGGAVSVEADNITLTGQEALFGIPTSIASISMGTARTSSLSVIAKRINLIDGGVITTNTFFSGEANTLSVYVSDTLLISGVAAIPYQMLDFPAFPYPSNITSASANPVDNGGQASNLFVQAKHIILNAGGTIGSMTYGSGDAGQTTVVADTIAISGWQDNGLLYRSGINSSSYNSESYAGCAGKITVTANQINIDDGGAINASTIHAGGGNIFLNVSDTLYLFNQGSITTSVQSGDCNSGNITIETPQFLIMNNSPIIAQADAGEGGNILIVANQFLQSANSLVSASSRLGIDGNIQITSPDETVSSSLLNLDKDFIQAVKIIDNCRTARIGQSPMAFQSALSFKVDLYRFPNYLIEDWQPSGFSSNNHLSVNRF